MAFVVTKIVGENYRRQVSGGKPAPVGVFLTATIAPPPSAVTRNDPEIRLKDYLAALEFYLSLPAEGVDRILFVDNSNFDLSPLARFVDERVTDKAVELISFDGNDHPVSYGKAYGEFKLMDFGIEQSQLLAGDDVFWKITGRLKFANLSEMIAAAPRHYDVLCDLHNFPIIGTGKVFSNRWMDLRAFSCSVKAYRVLFAGKYQRFGPCINQDMLYDIVMGSSKSIDIQPRFPIQPIIDGVSGRHDRHYHRRFQQLKTTIRAGTRKFMPRFWV
jgi:hypothetical protein